MVFDGCAAHHLEIAGAFPRPALAVTGSPGLDRLAARVRAIGPADARGGPRQPSGSPTAIAPRVVVSKRAQLGRWLPLLAAAIGRPGRVAGPPGAHAAGGQAASGGDRRRSTPTPLGPARPSRLAPPALDLPTLLAACDLVVTVNSTVAIDAMALGIPALSVGMPNNLTPFVVAGGIAGVYHPSELQPALAELLWDDAARADLVAKGLRLRRIRRGADRRRGRPPGGGRAGRAGRNRARPATCRRAEPPAAAIMVD